MERLPVELGQRVGQELPFRDLLSLRAASKSLWQGVTQHWAPTRFLQIPHLSHLLSHGEPQYRFTLFLESLLEQCNEEEEEALLVQVGVYGRVLVYPSKVKSLWRPKTSIKASQPSKPPRMSCKIKTSFTQLLELDTAVHLIQDSDPWSFHVHHPSSSSSLVRDSVTDISRRVLTRESSKALGTFSFVMRQFMRDLELQSLSNEGPQVMTQQWVSRPIPPLSPQEQDSTESTPTDREEEEDTYSSQSHHHYKHRLYPLDRSHPLVTLRIQELLCQGFLLKTMVDGMVGLLPSPIVGEDESWSAADELLDEPPHWQEFQVIDSCQGLQDIQIKLFGHEFPSLHTSLDNLFRHLAMLNRRWIELYHEFL